VFEELGACEFDGLDEPRGDVDVDAFDIERLGIDRTKPFFECVEMLVGAVEELDRVVFSTTQCEKLESERCFTVKWVQLLCESRRPCRRQFM